MNEKINPNGIILLDKKEGITSFEALYPVKKYINKKTGHAGTLDKFASGLLIALCGKSTKLFDTFASFDKEYIATFTFGERRDTDDREGKIIETSINVPGLDKIEKVIKEKFTGTISQFPPTYSAVHINGKRAYKLAREGGEVKTKAREINIYFFNVLSFDYPNLEVHLCVSKGCYIRSVARDLAKELDCCAYVSKLRRTRIGKYRVEDALKEDDIKSLADSNIQSI